MMDDLIKNFKLKLIIIIPTYNEADNIENLVRAIKSAGLTLPFDILVVDDASPDGTGRIVDELRKSVPNLFVLHREKKEGLGPAYIAGFRWAFERDYAW